MSVFSYKSDVGAVIRGLLNGLKHTTETISPLLGIQTAQFDAIIAGNEPLTAEIEQKLLSIRGINQRDFYPAELQATFPIIDDTTDGAIIMRAAETAQSQRTLARGPGPTPFYIYADTAMSNTSSFRPEWIQELYVDAGEDANALPDWAFNKGHFEHQVTYFIGPVNFYWIDKTGQKHVTQMNTGDTDYIVPFTPHTFTTREPGKGLILAVTYGGAIANPTFRADISTQSMETYLATTKETIAALPAPLLPEDGQGVVIKKRSPHTEIQEREALVHTQTQPDTHMQTCTLKPGGSMDETVASDRWIYQLGPGDVTLSWGNNHQTLLKTGDSVFLKPNTPHTVEVDAADTELLIVDIRPQVGDPYTELAVIAHCVGEAGLKRVHTETTRWY